FIPGLSNQGAERALIEAVRVEAGLRSQGVGGAMVRWAAQAARERGCAFIELLTHKSREAAQRFYARLGFQPSHEGMRLTFGPPA
ncbi:GNAT family N-acetyltransferase, partial [Phenylobacterium sp.]|uniref:GNAT family N-acetyltransferase n=1 Tax=Phenylobacterium sp. TaxID=1871053 RepID=UPI002F42A1E2